MQGPEEAWVIDPANAWRMQASPVWLAERLRADPHHNALRLRWQFEDPAPGDGEAVAAFLTRLADSGRTLDLKRLKEQRAEGKSPGWESLSTAQRTLAGEAVRDLDLSLAEIPDVCPGADCAYLAQALRDDLSLPASEALAKLEGLAGSCSASGARVPGFFGRRCAARSRLRSNPSRRGWMPAPFGASS